MKQDKKQEAAVQLLQEFARQNGRLPQKSDFDSETVCFIKQKLGPWPRALEQAKLK
jgi:hypothetical protein